MIVAATMQLQASDVLGMIASHLSKKYGKKIISVKPVLKTIPVRDSDGYVDSYKSELTHFEVSFEQDLSDTFGE